MPNRDKILALYRDIAGAHEGVEVKGKKTAYTAINGNMFSFLDPDGQLCLRLSDKDKAAYEGEHGTGDVIQYNAVMRGYVPVIQAVLANLPEMERLFSRAVENAKRLKPKPTKRKK